ncbi:uncharacterized protein [Physcomitrium patens]|uniref:uncharacterized protein isoform X1 n=1 Tax=Physcomitrium patens TaxID=3218 RepID=UPI003CCD8377
MLFAAGQRGSLNAVTSSAITPGGNPAMDWVGIEEPPCWNVDKRCEGLDEASLFGDRTTLDVTMTGTFHVLGLLFSIIKCVRWASLSLPFCIATAHHDTPESCIFLLLFCFFLVLCCVVLWTMGCCVALFVVVVEVVAYSVSL